MSYSTKRVTTVGMLIAMEVVLSRFLSIRIPPTTEYLLKLSFAFLPVAVAAMLFGPLWGSVCGALGDVIGALVFQPGSLYFPGFTLTAALTGAVFGVFLYNRRAALSNSLAAAAINSLILSLGLNSLWLYMLYKDSVAAMMPGRAINSAAMTAVQTLCVMFAYKALRRQREALCSDHKRDIRRSGRAYLASSAALRDAISESIAQRLLSAPEFTSAGTVFCYVGTEREIATDRIISTALSSGKKLCAPRCESDTEMTARLITSLDELAPGRYNLLEPPESAAVAPIGDIDLAVVPAAACGRDFGRVGSGGGYYDRYLAGSRAVKAALCAHARLRRTVPAIEGQDVRMDIIVTESETLRREQAR